MESIGKSAEEKQLFELCDPILRDHGYQIVDLDCRIGPKSLVRLFVESLENAKAVSLDDCVKATKAIEPALEQFPAIPGHFELEVSSPGLDRRLRTRADFEKVQGARIKLKLNESVPGFGAKPAGSLLKVGAEGITVEVDKRELILPWGLIRQANHVWPGPGGPGMSN